MNKKGMLYKRTFSAAASALMAISAIAPMSVLADGFTEENGDFDIVNEAAIEETKVYLNFDEDFLAKYDGIQTALDNAAAAKDEKEATTRLTALRGSLPDSQNIWMAVRTSAEGMISNSLGKRTFNEETKKYTLEETMGLNINLRNLLGLERSEDISFVKTARNALNNLYNKEATPSNLLDTHLLSGEIKFNIELPEGSAFKTTSSGKTFKNSLISSVAIEAEGSHATVTLSLNGKYDLGDLVNAMLGNNGDFLSVDIPYTTTYSLEPDNSLPVKTAIVNIDSNTSLLETNVNDKNLIIKVNGHDYLNPAKFDVLKSLSNSVKDDPEEPVKPVVKPSKPTVKPNVSIQRAMHRMFNPKTGEHLYTQSTEERDNLVRSGWNYENIGWYAPAGSSTPVYRVFNPNSGDHHYTTNLEEYQTLTRIGWNAEGIGWYSESDKGAPIYRLYNKKIKVGSHHYTQNAAERDKLVNEGWVYEGIAWYAMK